MKPDKENYKPIVRKLFDIIPDRYSRLLLTVLVITPILTVIALLGAILDVVIGMIIDMPKVCTILWSDAFYWNEEEEDD